MTYQEAVQDHMKDAPQELREYVCGRLIDDSWWEGSGNPILYSAVTWGKSKEGGNFWYYVSTKEWSNVMATLFWQSYIKQLKPEPSNEDAVCTTSVDQSEKYTRVKPHFTHPNPEPMTDYQEAVARHMKNAPVELREYVCGILNENDWWTEGDGPIDKCGFFWEDSEEGYEFWNAVDDKRWQDAMATDFWQNRNNEQTKTMTDYQNKIREQYTRLLDKQLAKNKDYGNSVFNDIEVFGETISAETSCKARIADKLKRLSSASFQVDESHDDTIDDLIGYLVAYRIIRNNKRHTKIEL